MNGFEIAQLAAQFKKDHANKPKSAARGPRYKIKAGSVQVGDKLFGRTVTGLGKIWSERVRDDEACVYGLQPGVDGQTVEVQYAYT